MISKMSQHTAKGLRRDAAEARKKARDARKVIQATTSPELTLFMRQVESIEEARAQELDRQADALDGGKPEPWWRSLPIPARSKG